jgi:hypothetical protein
MEKETEPVAEMLWYKNPERWIFPKCQSQRLLHTIIRNLQTNFFTLFPLTNSFIMNPVLSSVLWAQKIIKINTMYRKNCGDFNELCIL